MTSQRIFIGPSICAAFASVVGLFLLLTIRPALAQTTFGTLSNFDVFNDTGTECHGFEIELDGITSANITYKFGGTYERYGDPHVVDFPGGVYVRYESPYDSVNKVFAQTTPLAPTPITPTAGHACWTGGSANYPTAGCEHFGVGLTGNPTNTVYHWLVADPSKPGSLSYTGGKVRIPAPVWNVTPPAAPGAAPVVAAAIQAEPPEAFEFGDAKWVKVYKTESPDPAELNHLVTDDPRVPQDPVEIETEWSLSQASLAGGARAELLEEASLGANSQSVTRRYEFYAYTGAYDPETHEALPVNDSNPVPTDVGDYIGAQIVAVNIPPPTSMAVAASLDLGSSPVGNAAKRTLTVRNTGKNPLFVGNVTSSDSAEFAQSAQTCPAGGLAPGKSCTIQIAFTPGALGKCNAKLTIGYNGNRDQRTVSVRGVGTIDMAVSPPTIAIGMTRFGAKVVKKITVSNKQGNAVALSEAFTGPNAPDFAVTGGTCGPTLAAKASCSLMVTFTPGAWGIESAKLNITSSPDRLSPYFVSFAVAGTMTPATIAPLTLSYGRVSRNASKTMSLLVINHVPVSMTLSKNVSGRNAGDFTITGGSCGVTLARGPAICHLAVRFKPTTAEPESAMLDLSFGGDLSSPHSVILVGIGF